MNIEEIKKQAKKELEEEKTRKLIDIEKDKMRYKKSFFKKIFPWKIVIIRNKE